MTSKTTNTTKADWTKRIVFLLRRADTRQLREIYYIISGYLSAFLPPFVSFPPEPEGGAEDRVVQ